VALAVDLLVITEVEQVDIKKSAAINTQADNLTKSGD
jgi:hypothetical protein